MSDLGRFPSCTCLSKRLKSCNVIFSSAAAIDMPGCLPGLLPAAVEDLPILVASEESATATAAAAAAMVDASAAASAAAEHAVPAPAQDEAGPAPSAPPTTPAGPK